MPTISVFYGIIIRMFFDDHAPPHFHASYSGQEAQIDIKTLQIIKGKLPNKALSLVQEWGQLHHEQLMENWKLCAEQVLPKKIQPL